MPIIEKEDFDDYQQFKQTENARKLSIEYFKKEQSKLDSKMKKAPKHRNLKAFTCFHDDIIQDGAQAYDLSRNENRLQQKINDANETSIKITGAPVGYN